MVDTKKVTEENLVETAQEEDDQIEQSIDDVAINVEADDKEPLLKWCDKKQKLKICDNIWGLIFHTCVLTDECTVMLINIIFSVLIWKIVNTKWSLIKIWI